MQAQPEVTKRDLETRLIEKAWKDPEFKRQVIADPKGMLEKQLGRKLPTKLTITIHEEDSNTLHFSLPPAPSNMNELSDEELERVSGGTEIIIMATATVVAAISGSAVGAAVGSAAYATKVDHGW